MTSIEFTLTIDETNTVLEGLGNLPFKQVFRLVQKLEVSAQRQLAANEKGDARAGAQPESPGETSLMEATSVAVGA